MSSFPAVESVLVPRSLPLGPPMLLLGPGPLFFPLQPCPCVSRLLLACAFRQLNGVVLQHRRGRLGRRRRRVRRHETKTGKGSDELTNSTKPGSGCIGGQPGTGEMYGIAVPSTPLRTSMASLSQRAISASLGGEALSRAFRRSVNP